ncbi:hypothetical protein QUC31_002162 [Theobroma cacao]
MEGAVRVQILSQAGISEVPSQYIQPPENRPTPVTNTKTSLSCDNVPAIDLSHKEKSVIAAIQEACQELGAFHVINHGVPTKLMDDLRRSCLSFFNDFPMEDKLKYACQPNSAASQGYGSRMLVSSENDTVLDWRDYFDHHTLPLSRRNPSFWPHFPPEYRGLVADYSDEMKIITNGKYRSSVHQAVTNASKARLSIATFHDPAKAVRISPAADLLSESSPPRYAPVVYGDHVSSWYSKGPEGKRNLDALLLDT